MAIELRGNTHMPRGKIIKALEQIAAESWVAFGALHRLRVEEWHQSLPYRLGEFYFNERFSHHKPKFGDKAAQTFDQFLEMSNTTPEKFLASIDESRLDMAYEAGIFSLPARYDFHLGEEAIEHMADKLAADSAHANRMSGHKFNSYRERNGNGNGRSSGGGFKYRPEIPYHSPPVSTANIVRRVRKWNELEASPEIKAMYGGYFDDSLSKLHPMDSEVVYRQRYGRRNHPDYRQRYGRRNHPEQSMPKIDWQAERDWRNQRHKTRTKQNAAYLTSRESQRARESVAKLHEAI